MLRSALVTSISIGITAFLFIFWFNSVEVMPNLTQISAIFQTPEMAKEKNKPYLSHENKYESAREGLIQQEYKKAPTLNINIEGDLEEIGKLKDLVKEAHKYFNEAQPLTAYKDRFALIEKINKFKEGFGVALAETNYTEGGRRDALIFLEQNISYYISLWSPFYYYIPQDAQNVLRPYINNLESERASILRELVKLDAERAGALAAKDLKFYIEDIRKSAARRNSDFIDFSVLDFNDYKTLFDELALLSPEFSRGFAETAPVLLDDLYAMHEEVDGDYLDKTKDKVEQVRLDVINYHKNSILELRKTDAKRASSVIEKTLSVIEKKLSTRANLLDEMRDIMNKDYKFYESIK